MKKLLFIILSLILVISLSACHGTKMLEPFYMPDSFDMNRNYEISFWSKNDSNLTQKAIYQQAIVDFEKVYPNIKVNLRSFTNYEDIYKEVLNNISTKTTPNVAITYPDHVAKYLTGNNVIVNLDELIDDTKYGLGGTEVKFDGVSKADVESKFLNECFFHNHYFSIPFMRSTEACYINKDYVESLGYTVPDILTWDYIFEVSEKAIEEKREDQVLIPFIYKSVDNMMIQMLKQKGYAYSTDEAEILIFNDDTKSILETLGSHAKTGAFSIFAIESYPGNYLNAGQCIFAIDSTAGATWMGMNSPQREIDEESIANFETVVRAIPQYDIENPTMISQGPSLCLFNKDDKEEVLASWLFTQFLLSNSVQNAYAMTEGYIPVTSKAYNSDEYQNYLSRAGENNDLYYDIKIEASILTHSYINNTFITPVFNGSASLRNAAGYLIEDTVKSTRRKVELNDEYFKTLFKNTNSLYKLDQIQKTGDEGNAKAKINYTSISNGSKALLITLSVVYLGIIVYYIQNKIKNRHKNDYSKRY